MVTDGGAVSRRISEQLRGWTGTSTGIALDATDFDADTFTPCSR